MRKSNLMRIVVVMAALAAFSLASVAQTQNQQGQTQNQTQAQPNQAQQNQAQPNQNQTNQTQPAPKQSFWQKMKASAMQGAQNSVQQGSQQIQQGAQQGVQGAQQGIQQGVQGVQGQGMQGVQQGVQQVVPGSSQGGAAFSGSGSSGACGPSCFNAGPFQANISQMILSQQGAWHVIRMNIQFHNSTNQPLIIAYHEGSMSMVDNNGNAYVPAGGNPSEVQGMGVDRGSQTDSTFTLSPGQTGNAMFATARVRGNTSPVGTAYSYNFTIDELQNQNGAMAIPVRTYDLNFASLSPGTTSASAFQSGSPASSYAGGSTGASSVPSSYAGAGTPAVQGAQPASAQGSAQPATAQAKTATPAVQQKMVNGRPVVVVVPNSAVKNAVMRSTTTTAPAAAAPAKPIPTTTNTAKKPATTTTQTSTNTPK